MASTVELWTPPAGMKPVVVKEWRAFYSRALDLYDVTPQRYRALYLLQKGRCWICRTATGKHPDDPNGRGGRRLGIDHNHTTGVVRGLLCTGGDKTCNRIIGWLTAPALRRAANYLDGTRTPGPTLERVEHLGLPMEIAEMALWSEQTDVPVVPDKSNYGVPDGACSPGCPTGEWHEHHSADYVAPPSRPSENLAPCEACGQFLCGHRDAP